MTYLVTNGPASAQQLVRVDVVPGNSDGAPVAVRDIALLPSGGNVLVDVLGNDSDPSGGVLVVQSVTADYALPVSVSVLDHSVVRITDIRAEGQLSLKYTISNGRASAERRDRRRGGPRAHQTAGAAGQTRRSHGARR